MLNIYFSGLKVNKSVQGLYRNVLVASYVNYFNDYALKSAILDVNDEFINLPDKDRFSYFKEVIICCNVLIYSGEMTTLFIEMIGRDRKEFGFYLQDFAASGEYKKLNKEEKKRIMFWVDALSYIY